MRMVRWQWQEGGGSLSGVPRHRKGDGAPASTQMHYMQLHRKIEYQHGGVPPLSRFRVGERCQSVNEGSRKANREISNLMNNKTAVWINAAVGILWIGIGLRDVFGPGLFSFSPSVANDSTIIPDFTAGVIFLFIAFCFQKIGLHKLQNSSH